VEISAGIQWSEVLQLLADLGYPAKILRPEDGDTAQKLDHRKQLVRLALAGFCAGNVMLLSVSVYAGADGWWALSFGWISLFLALPALFYSAAPLYRSAFLPLRHARISVDLPIALALLAGFSLSAWNLLQGTLADTYFDSLTMLVFLLLSSRYLLSRIRASLALESPFLSFLAGDLYKDTGGHALAVREILEGTELELREGQIVPTDCTLLSDHAYFDLSLLNGESVPLHFHQGDSLDSGGKLLSSSALVRASKQASQSRLAGILAQIRAYQVGRSRSVAFADQMGRYFVFAVLGLSAAILALMPNEEGLRRALALVIVTCPCVLAFAVPLALTRALQLAAKKGILIRTAEKIEELAAARHLYLDKTGTVSTGRYDVIQWEQVTGDLAETKSAALSLESLSPHPVAKAIAIFTRAEKAGLVADFREIPGDGVSGSINGTAWSVVRLSTPGQDLKNHVGVFRGDTLAARVELGDSIRPEAPSVLDQLRKLGLGLHLISGDSEANVAATARILGITDWKSRLLPEAKASILAREKNCVMVGDGANDAVAFQAATVGISVQGAVEMSLQNSDITLTRPGLWGLLDAIRLARKTVGILKINFAVTLSYNLLAGFLALSGQMSPLLAAVIMPCSAMSVFAFTQWASQEES
jgi:Cu+-exporting ATPase